MRYKTLILAIATALGMMSASAIKADHEFIQQQTKELECQMNELRTVFYHQFRESGVYSELRSTAWDIRNDARQIERLARRGTSICDLRSAIDDTEQCLGRLYALVGEARYRAETGIDPPLCGCTLHVDAKLIAARETLACLRGVLLGGVAYTAPTYGYVPATNWQAQQPQYPGYNAPQAPVPGYNGSAPAWTPRNATSNGVLPQGHYDEVGPPLSGRGHNSGPTLSNPHYQDRGSLNRTAGRTGNGQPIGVYGQRGNGVELNNGGVVLRIGGAAIRF